MDSLNDNFNNVVELCQKSYGTDEIFDILKNGSVLEKQVAVLNLNELRSKSDVQILMDNLTGIDGKVRQAVAYKILQLMPQYSDYFKDESNYDIFANSIIDIDSNVCRLIIDSIQYLKDDKNFSFYIAEKMKDIIFDALSTLSKISYKSKKYTSNKQYFKIYWCLETLKDFYDYLDSDGLEKILSACSDIPEYTIREKCAVILKLLPDDKFSEIKLKLSSDDNYYVRNV